MVQLVVLAAVVLKPAAVAAAAVVRYAVTELAFAERSAEHSTFEPVVCELAAAAARGVVVIVVA